MSGLLGGPKIQQPTPVALKDPNDPRIKDAAANEARRRAMSGRAGTNLSDASGGAYSGDKLGR